AAARADLASRRHQYIQDVGGLLHHQPFTHMARPQLAALAEHTGAALSDLLLDESMSSNRAHGHTHPASLSFALTSQLHNDPELACKRLGFLSDGSGAVADFCTGVVQEHYRGHI